MGRQMADCTLKFCEHCGETAHTLCRSPKACACPINKPSIDTPLDRGDAVNLARNYLDGMYLNGLTPKGVETLAKAVMAMDDVLRKCQKNS